MFLVLFLLDMTHVCVPRFHLEDLHVVKIMLLFFDIKNYTAAILMLMLYWIMILQNFYVLFISNCSLLSKLSIFKIKNIRCHFAGTIVKPEQKALLDHVMFSKYMLNCVHITIIMLHLLWGGLPLHSGSCRWHAV
jgi:hypothetical protein